tara:strand:- start:31 stop:288 length:258 start_codon:yes stop_codon:yes gene_type:complete
MSLNSFSTRAFPNDQVNDLDGLPDFFQDDQDDNGTWEPYDGDYPVFEEGDADIFERIELSAFMIDAHLVDPPMANEQRKLRKQCR